MQTSIEDRRQAIVERLKKARDTHQRCLSDVTAEAGNVGSEWSIADLLRHSSGDGYRNMITRLLDEDKPKFIQSDFDKIESSFIKFKDISEPSLIKTGYFIPVSGGHNGNLTQNERLLYEIHLMNAGFINEGKPVSDYSD